jgi:hypothetical protein
VAGTSLAVTPGVAVAPSIEDSGGSETMEVGKVVDVGAGDGPRLLHAQSVITTRPRVAILAVQAFEDPVAKESSSCLLGWEPIGVEGRIAPRS